MAGGRRVAVDERQIEHARQRRGAGGLDLAELPLAGVPPICSSSAAPVAWENAPLTVSVLPAPRVSAPLLAKAAAVVKVAPPVSAKAPLLDARPVIPVIVALAPSIVILAALLVMLVPLGNSIVAPLSAFQIPPVSKLPETWVIEIASS